MYVIQTFISLFPLPYLQTLFSLSSLIVENNRDYKINKIHRFIWRFHNGLVLVARGLVGVNLIKISYRKLEEKYKLIECKTLKVKLCVSCWQ